MLASPKPSQKSPSLDTVTTINEDGSRYFVHPSDTRGTFTLLRRVVALFLFAAFLLPPWIQINGKPAVFLDVANRQFHLFGLTLVSQDLWLGFFLLTGVGFGLFYVTALFGRVWCGWACPQTVFLEHLYRRIERWIDGDAPARRKLDAAPWSTGKAFKRILKHGIFLALSAALAHLFLAYFVSIPGLYRMILDSPLSHWPIFLFVSALSLVLYGNFAWFREQFCIVLCPYGRLQSALIDDNSVVIGYDEKRGEPRGKASDPNTGDCIDCRRCVQVCPTGIDIRQGLQLECVGCSNCIDVCDEVMTKLSRPKGLIRYDSLNGLHGKPTQFLRPRTILYSIFLLVGCVVALVAFSRVRPATVTVLRMVGSPYYLDGSNVRNQFMVRIINKKSEPAEFTVEAKAPIEGLSSAGADGPIRIDGRADTTRALVVTAPRAKAFGRTPLQVSVRGTSGGFQETQEAEFLAPDKP